jgi:hypothetical protein
VYDCSYENVENASSHFRHCQENPRERSVAHINIPVGQQKIDSSSCSNIYSSDLPLKGKRDCQPNAGRVEKRWKRLVEEIIKVTKADRTKWSSMVAKRIHIN